MDRSGVVGKGREENRTAVGASTEHVCAGTTKAVCLTVSIATTILFCQAGGGHDDWKYETVSNFIFKKTGRIELFTGQFSSSFRFRADHWSETRDCRAGTGGLAVQA